MQGRTSPRLRAVALATMAMSLTLAAGRAGATVYDWRAGTASFSAASSWSGGLPPGSDSTGKTTTLRFGSPTSAAFTATNDSIGPLALNQLVLAGSGVGGSGTTLRNAGGAGFAFAGSGAAIDARQATGKTVISDAGGGLGIATGSQDLAIRMGAGSLQIGSVISGGGGLVIDGTQSTYSQGALLLSGNNTFTGNVTLNSGNLQISSPFASATPLGKGALIVNGGTLTAASSALQLNNALQLNADLRVINGTLSFNGAIAANDAAARLVNEGATMTLTTAAPIGGATQVGVNSGYYPNVGPATLTLSGNGSLLSTSAIELAAGGTLILDNTGVNSANRVNDAAALRVNSGTVQLRANAAGSREQLGDASFQGLSAFEVRPGTGASGQAGVLELASLTRENRGVLLVRGQNLGASTAVANRATLLIDGAAPALVGGGGAAGSTNQSIVPWAVGYQSTTASSNTAQRFNGLVTYDAVTGLRPLAPTEYATALGLSAADNVLLDGASVGSTVTNNAKTTVNALVLKDVNVAGGGMLRITSGALAITGISTGLSSGNAIDFGSAEGIVTTNNGYTLAGNLTGSNGLTKSGYNSLLLSGDNRGLTGTLTINGEANTSNGSRIDINSANALPGTGAIIVNGAALTASAGIGVQGSIIVARDIVANSGYVGLTTLSAASSATFSGTISGPGTVNINSSGSWGLVTLSGDNSYTGATRLNAGYLEISRDANLGKGGTLVLATNTTDQGLQLAGNWTSSRTVQVLYPTGLNDRGFDTTLNGTVSGDGNLLKLGAGTLTLNADSTMGGTLSIAEGNLFVNAKLQAPVFFDGTLLGGTGHTGALDFFGILSPGSAAQPFAAFGASSMTLYVGSTLRFDLGNGGDQLLIDGALTRAVDVGQDAATPVTFAFSEMAGLQVGDSIALLHFGSTNFSADQFAYTGPDGLEGRFLIKGNELVFAVSAVGAVPEPGQWALLLAGGLAVGGVVRRKRRQQP